MLSLFIKGKMQSQTSRSYFKMQKCPIASHHTWETKLSIIIIIIIDDLFKFHITDPSMIFN